MHKPSNWDAWDSADPRGPLTCTVAGAGTGPEGAARAAHGPCAREGQRHTNAVLGDTL